MNSHQRIFGLDLMRAIAIILVVISHGHFILEGTVLSGFPWIPTLDGVELFFVLSGFLIGGILLRTIPEDGHIDFKFLKSFWIRRWFRTLPNYYLILLLNIGLVYFGWIDGNLARFNWKFFVFLQNFNAPFMGFFWESWSLSIEEWFYIFIPISLLMALKFTGKKKAFLWVIVLFTILPLLYRFYLMPKNVDYFWWDITFRKMVTTRLDTIIWGVLAAWIYFYHPKFWMNSKWYAALLAILLFVIVISIERKPNHWYTKTIFFTLTSLSAMFWLPLLNGLKKIPILIGKPIVFLSTISYAMYLLNLGPIAQVIQKNVIFESETSRYLWFVLFWFLVVSLSTLLYFLFEKPMTALRNRFK